ncbi:linear amide C-N hydrolase [Hydrogenovibrio kuenenii]|uniref:linear amide C-N hydrolase n=1 Tax=Hydrogenovibrio kuenenii TaxID=63658 RepID=UPI00046556AB|nr:choloylglycine hydrolase family protein [Hydrogenovibrio kuenenii]
MQIKKFIHTLMGTLLLLSALTTSVQACTGIRLTTEDGSTVYGRTNEWGAFDLNSRVAAVPSGYHFRGLTPDGNNGKKWTGKYNFLGLDAIGKDVFIDGMNEKGLAVGFFYHKGFAHYMKYDKKKARNTITATDMVSYLLSQFKNVDEVEKAVKHVRVVAVKEASLGIPAYAHWMVTEASGKSIVIEYIDGKLKLYKNPLGVITNNPTYDWQMTNLRNYLNLSINPAPNRKIAGIEFTPLSGGSGMVGLPGDFTSTSRFVRAAVWSHTDQPLKNSNDAVYELFRILDNFDVPLKSAEGSDNKEKNVTGMRSSTQWTTAWDLKHRVLFFHTQYNRRVQEVDLNKVKFVPNTIVHTPMDPTKQQDIHNITMNLK